jgi:hypothetical protein
MKVNADAEVAENTDEAEDEVLEKLINEGKRLQDSSDTSSDVYLWLAEVEEYNNSKKESIIYSELSSAISTAKFHSSPESYYNKIIGYLDYFNYKTDNYDILELIAEGETLQRNSVVNSNVYTWLARVKDINIQNKDLSTYNDLSSVLSSAMFHSSPNSYYSKILGYMAYMSKLLENAVTTITTTTTTTTTTKVVTTTTVYDGDCMDISGHTRPTRNPTPATHDTLTSTTGDLGDLNNDNSIDSKDATIVLIKYAEALVNDKVIKASELPAGDYNKDGYVDAKDATSILVAYAEWLIEL